MDGKGADMDPKLSSAGTPELDERARVTIESILDEEADLPLAAKHGNAR